MTCPGIEVKSLIYRIGSVAGVCRKFFEDNVAEGINLNEAVPAYVTTPDRLNLYEYLSNLGSLFCNVIQTRSSSFRSIRNPKRKTGEYPGEFTDELEKNGVAPLSKNLYRVAKNKSFFIFFHSTGKPATKYKGKATILNYENSTY